MGLAHRHLHWRSPKPTSENTRFYRRGCWMTFLKNSPVVRAALRNEALKWDLLCPHQHQGTITDGQPCQVSVLSHWRGRAVWGPAFALGQMQTRKGAPSMPPPPRLCPTPRACTHELREPIKLLKCRPLNDFATSTEKLSLATMK